MEVKIGVQHSAREIVLESIQTPDEVLATVTAAVSSGSLMVLAGYFLGEVPLVANNIDTAILLVIVVTSLPFPLELLREYLARRRAN